MRSHWPTAISTEPPCTQLTPSSANEHVENADTRGAEIAQNEPLPIDPLENADTVQGPSAPHLEHVSVNTVQCIGSGGIIIALSASRIAPPRFTAVAAHDEEPCAASLRGVEQPTGRTYRTVGYIVVPNSGDAVPFEVFDRGFDAIALLG